MQCKRGNLQETLTEAARSLQLRGNSDISEDLNKHLILLMDLLNIKKTLQ